MQKTLTDLQTKELRKIRTKIEKMDLGIEPQTLSYPKYNGEIRSALVFGNYGKSKEDAQKYRKNAVAFMENEIVKSFLDTNNIGIAFDEYLTRQYDGEYRSLRVILLPRNA